MIDLKTEVISGTSKKTNKKYYCINVVSDNGYMLCHYFLTKNDIIALGLPYED